MTGEPSGSTPIRELDPATVDRIAAGEVVERPVFTATKRRSETRAKFYRA